MACAALPLAAWAVDAPAGGVVVVQAGRHFAVETLRIARGSVVRFVNADEFDHQIFIQSDGFVFESEEQEPGHTVNVAFTSAGTFPVRCHIHPKMHLSVTVSGPG